MSLVIDANMRVFAEKLNISSSRMIDEYGLSTIDEIIEAEAARGNSKAISHANEFYQSPQKLIDIFNLTSVENKFVLIKSMDDRTREMLLPLLTNDDLVMGLYFFTQEKLLNMLMEVNIEELVRVILTAFPFEDIIQMFTEEDMQAFFLNRDLPKEVVVEQMKLMPPDIMQKFVESVTGRPANETDPMELIDSLAQMQDEKFSKFMACVDPDVQRQLIFQITKEEPEYLQLFPNETYVNMLAKLQKPDMIKPLVMLNKETLMNMNLLLTDELLSIVLSQIDTKEFAKFLQDGHMDILGGAWMI